MIRTNTVTLSAMPALAYRQKMTSGGASIVILRADAIQPGVASISKTSGEPIIAKNTPADLYPAEAFAEAIELTAGMPYHKQGKPRIVAQDLEHPQIEEEPAEEAVAEEETLVDSGDYQAIVDAYTDKKGKLSYALLNKELIQFAHGSEVVQRMLDAGEDEAAIRLYAVGTKFRNVTGNKDLTDGQVFKIAELLDEVSPKGVFKEFTADIRAKLSERKRG